VIAEKKANEVKIMK